MISKHWWPALLIAGLTFGCSEAQPLAPIGSDETAERSTSRADESSTTPEQSSDASDGSDASQTSQDAPDGGSPKPAEPDGGKNGTAVEETGVEVDSGPPPPVTGRYDAGVLPDASAIEFDSDCDGNRAFIATGGAFVDPTPPKLALRLNQDIYRQPAVTLVLLNEEHPPRMTASYSVGTAFGQAFSNLKPDLVQARGSASGFTYEHTQLRGWMWIQRDAGPIELPLRNLHVTATALDSCTRVLFTLSAVVPAEDVDLIAPDLELDAGGGPREDQVAETSIRALFEAELTHFDFGSLP